MKKILNLIKQKVSMKSQQRSSLKILESKKEKMKAELESLSEFERFLKELTKQQ